MILEVVGDTLEIIGAILIAITVILVHETVVQEHKIDKRVSKTVRKEHVIVIIAIFCLIVGYVLQQLGKHAY